MFQVHCIQPTSLYELAETYKFVYELQSKQIMFVLHLLSVNQNQICGYFFPFLHYGMFLFSLFSYFVTAMSGLMLLGFFARVIREKMTQSSSSFYTALVVYFASHKSRIYAYFMLLMPKSSRTRTVKSMVALIYDLSNNLVSATLLLLVMFIDRF